GNRMYVSSARTADAAVWQSWCLHVVIVIKKAVPLVEPRTRLGTVRFVPTLGRRNRRRHQVLFSASMPNDTADSRGIDSTRAPGGARISHPQQAVSGCYTERHAARFSTSRAMLSGILIGTSFSSGLAERRSSADGTHCRPLPGHAPVGRPPAA